MPLLASFGQAGNTVQRYASSPGFPERAEGSGLRASGRSKLDPYLPYLREQWEGGIHNCAHLFDLIKERGYTGCRSGLRKRLAEWRTELPLKRWRGNPPKPRLFAQRGQRRLSSRSASFLMILPPEKLTAKQQQQVEHICQASSDLHTVYLLSQEFVTMLKERQAEALDGWRVSSKAGSRDGTGQQCLRDSSRLCRRSRCLLPGRWSNGITEGHVNRLKFLKRQMFGRAHLDLLRVKVLHAV